MASLCWFQLCAGLHDSVFVGLPFSSFTPDRGQVTSTGLPAPLSMLITKSPALMRKDFQSAHRKHGPILEKVLVRYETEMEVTSVGDENVSLLAPLAGLLIKLPRQINRNNI